MKFIIAIAIMLSLSACATAPASVRLANAERHCRVDSYSGDHYVNNYQRDEQLAVTPDQQYARCVSRARGNLGLN